jgi:hypothetical protein
MKGKKREITDEQRRMVRAMAAHGLGWAQISEVLGMPMRTAKRLLLKEYQGQAAHRNLAVAMALHAKAVGWVERDASGAIRKRYPPDTVACIWWTKARMGWREAEGPMTADPNQNSTAAIVIPGAQIPPMRQEQEQAADAG